MKDITQKLSETTLHDDKVAKGNLDSEKQLVAPNVTLKYQDILPYCADNQKVCDKWGLYTPEVFGKLTLFTALAKAKFNLIEADQLFKEELVKSKTALPGILAEMKKVTEEQQISNGIVNAMWIGADPLTADHLPSIQREVNEMYNLLDSLCKGYGKEGNIFGYGMVTTVIAAWNSLKRPDSIMHPGRKIMQTMTPNIKIPFGNLIKRCAKKRLLTKMDIPVYEEFSTKLGYTHNIGVCCTAYVAWSGWYVMSCSETSPLPFERAKLIGTLETTGMTNWASVDNIFKHPSFKEFAWAAVKELEKPDWRSDPACLAAIWGPFYCDVKRRAVERGEWPVSGIYEDWSYAAAQPAENVALAAAELLYESGCEPALMIEYHTLFRRYDDLLDASTDCVTGEENNQLYARLMPHFHENTSREKLASVCMEYCDDLIKLRRRISKIADSTGKGFQARMFARNSPLWFVWISRYNSWNKFLLGMKSGVVKDEQAQPIIRWEMVDTSYMAKVFKNAGCDCAKGKYAFFLNTVRAQMSVDTKSEEHPAFVQLYSTFVAGILGVLFCHSSGCNCAEQLAEYMDAERGGEILRFILDTLYSSEEAKLRHNDLILELIDSDQFAIYRYVAAGVGYFFQELTQASTGSLLEHCSL